MGESTAEPVARFGRWRALGTLVGGQSVAQIVPLAAAPAITRLFDPHDYGLFVSATAVAAVVAAAAHGRYQRALVVVRTDHEARALVALSLLLTSVVTVVATVVALLLVLGPAGLSGVYLLVPLLALLSAAFDVFIHFSLRAHRDVGIATATVLRAVVSASTQILFGFLTMGAMGLVLGTVAGSTAALLPFVWIGRTMRGTGRPSWREVTQAGRRHRSFPLFDLPANLLVVLTYNGLILMMPVLYSPSVAGQVALALRVLGLPADFVGTAIGQVYFRQIASKEASAAALMRFHWRTAVGLLLVATPMSLVIVGAGPELFALVFGSDWRDAGVYAAALTPMIWSRMVTTPFVSAFHVAGRQRLLLTMESLLFACTATVLLLTHLTAWPAQTGLLFLAVSVMVVYGVYFIVATGALRRFLASRETAEQVGPTDAVEGDQPASPSTDR